MVVPLEAADWGAQGITQVTLRDFLQRLPVYGDGSALAAIARWKWRNPLLPPCRLALVIPSRDRRTGIRAGGVN